MSDDNILIKEQCGSFGNIVNYRKDEQQNTIISEVAGKNSVAESLIQSIGSILREILLPYGYPESVSKDYFEYQLWDTVQAFCSTITSIFTTQAILKGVGVGNAEASALSATITWIMKDGTGMLGRIIFTWYKGNVLDGDCKKWRLVADIINDSAMALELLIPSISHLSLEVLCISTALKAIVGVAGGATRASITNHQAMKDNTAEISAKDGSQETLVNLIASFTGLFLLNYFTDHIVQWILIILMVTLHLYANYRAVTALIFDNLNESRMALVLKDYLIVNAIMSPERINKQESVFLGFGLKVKDFCGFNIILGQSLKNIINSFGPEELRSHATVYSNRNYLLLVNIKKRIIHVAFEKGENGRIVIAAYYHAVLLAIATCLYNTEQLDIYSKRQLHHTTPMTRLSTFMKSFHYNIDTPQNVPINILLPFNEFIDAELDMFFMALEVKKWRINNHSLLIDEWRHSWKNPQKKVD